MTLTNTVTSLAHDAAQAASDLGGQAVELGNKAAEMGSEAATSVASAATHLAKALSSKVPTIQPKRTTSPWAVLAVLMGLAAVVAVVIKRKRKSAPSASPGMDSAPAPQNILVDNSVMG